MADAPHYESSLAMLTRMLRDGADAFKVSVHEAATKDRVVLFAVGAGGQPERYATLLATLAASGCTVVAPHFERLNSPAPTEAALSLRARRLSLALDAFVPPTAPVMAVGHSIGAATLVAMAGAHLWLGPGRRVPIAQDSRLARLALLAPPTGFFQAPGALDAVQLPILAWVGSSDGITPPAQTEWLAQAMRAWNTVTVRVTPGAGHFSFMDMPPPQSTEPLSNRQLFLQAFSRDVCAFLIG